MYQTKICRICGQSFEPDSSRQLDCRKSVYKTCCICGEQFESICSLQNKEITCSKQCRNRLIQNKGKEFFQNSTRICKLCGEEFHPKNNTQLYCDKDHYRTCSICGKQFTLKRNNFGKYPNFNDLPKTCSKECSYNLRFKEGNPLSRSECREKSLITYKQKTGYDYPMKNPDVLDKISETYESRTGYDHPSHNPEVRSKIVSDIKLENFVALFLQENNINFKRQYLISKEKYYHCFDFYLFDYNIFVDVDGIYFHSYNQDPDGKHSLEYYDEERLYVIPDNSFFYLIVEDNVDNDIEELKRILKLIDNNDFDYRKYMFQWIRSFSFPYPSYSDNRMKRDFNMLCNCNCEKYISSNLLGQSIVKNFHHSMYDVYFKDVWNNDDYIECLIRKRYVYRNDYEHSKMLCGFNLDKERHPFYICNPVLSRYITLKYLNEFKTVFDPYPRFSCNLLGVCSTNKNYMIEKSDNESYFERNSIIEFLGLNSNVQYEDNLNGESSFECLFTFLPKIDFNSDGIIEKCLNTYKCLKYMFVVDYTDKYEDNIVESVKSISHYNKEKQFIIMFDTKKG